MRKALIDSLGPKSDDWIGRGICIFLRPMAQKDGNDGPPRFEKAVESLDAPTPESQVTTGAGELAAADVSW